MNRIDFLKSLPLGVAAFLFPRSSTEAQTEPQRIIEHIHINGDGATISHNVIHGSGKQPAIAITRPVKLYGPDGKLVFRGGIAGGGR